MKLLYHSLLFAIYVLQAQEIEITKFNLAEHGEGVKSIINENEAQLIINAAQDTESLYTLCITDQFNGCQPRQNDRFVAMQDGCVIGFVNGCMLYEPNTNQPKVKRVYSVVVKSECRKQGYGRRLLQTFMDQEPQVIGTRGKRQVMATALMTNVEARSFYAACGLPHAGDLTKFDESLYKLGGTCWSQEKIDAKLENIAANRLNLQEKDLS